MQVRTLSIKTTEILHLEMAMRTEAEGLIDEIDALLFSFEGERLHPSQSKALETRLKALSQLGHLLPQHPMFPHLVRSLETKVRLWVIEPHGSSYAQIWKELQNLKESLINRAPGSSPKAHGSTQKCNSPMPLAAAPIDKNQKKNGQDSKDIRKQTAHLANLGSIRMQLQQEFSLATAAIRDLLALELDRQKKDQSRLFQASSLVTHTELIFRDLEVTLAGQLPKQRPRLELIPSMILEQNHGYFALPQKNILSIFQFGANTGALARCNLPGGNIIDFNGNLLPELSLAEILNFDSNSEKNQTLILVSSGSGPFFLRTETEGAYANLLLDTATPLLKGFGPYLGVALSESPTSDGAFLPTIVLDPDALGASIGHSGGKTLPSKAVIPSTGKPSDQHQEVYSLAARSVENSVIAIPMAQVLHIELIPKNSVKCHNGHLFLLIGEKLVPAFDPDWIISKKKADETLYPEYLQGIITQDNEGISAILVAEVMGQELLTEITNFGFAPRPGVLGIAICGNQIASVLELNTIPK